MPRAPCLCLLYARVAARYLLTRRYARCCRVAARGWRHIIRHFRLRYILFDADAFADRCLSLMLILLIFLLPPLAADAIHMLLMIITFIFRQIFFHHAMPLFSMFSVSPFYAFIVIFVIYIVYYA